MTHPQNSDELLPCPFCGGDALIKKFDFVVNPKRYIAQCDSCNFEHKTQYSEEQAIAAWNTRHRPKVSLSEMLHVIRINAVDLLYHIQTYEAAKTQAAPVCDAKVQEIKPCPYINGFGSDNDKVSFILQRYEHYSDFVLFGEGKPARCFRFDNAIIPATVSPDGGSPAKLIGATCICGRAMRITGNFQPNHSDWQKVMDEASCAKTQTNDLHHLNAIIAICQRNLGKE